MEHGAGKCMANRHSNKRLRSHVRRRMAETGETYQQALTALRQEQARRQGRGSNELVRVDLIPARYFGWPITLAVFEAAEPVGRPVIMRIPSPHDGGAWSRMPLPLMNFRVAGWQ